MALGETLHVTPSPRENVAPVKKAPVKKVEAEIKSKQAKAEAEAEVQARKAEKAQREASIDIPRDDTSVRLIVRDPNHNEVHNIIVEIRSGEKVVATVPAKELLQVYDFLSRITESTFKGLFVNDTLG